ncbi:MAG: hypothetical protein LBE81_06530 [Azonexus sp.]|jgi:hypothetical protein|uniref:hypothetical protein n=1 Tax=Azonexus sp. TaxID=1872668 RepID=UPI00281D2F0B|nr:hypothetical protein [Azonexus sp.]MDR0776279.1 hypothetical protein [Azonexus sp.]
MNLLNFIAKKTGEALARGVILNGDPKKNGGHDHRYNRGDDRTPAQAEGDRKRRNPKT